MVRFYTEMCPQGSPLTREKEHQNLLQNLRITLGKRVAYLGDKITQNLFLYLSKIYSMLKAGFLKTIQY